MSNRQLRRSGFIKDDIAALADLAGSSSEDEDPGSGSFTSRFANFDELVEGATAVSSVDEAPVVDQSKPDTKSEAVSSVPSGKKKKRKKKAKGKRTDISEATDDDGFPLSSAAFDTPTPTIGYTFPGAGQTTSFFSATNSFLKVDTRYLKPGFELRKRFGADVFNEMDATGASRSHRSTLKTRTKLTEPKPNWPRHAKTGLYMEFVEKLADGSSTYTFKHNADYQEVQLRFWAAIDGHDHAAVNEIYQRHPYHMDTLLSLADVCRMQDEHQQAFNLTEMALYSAEMAFHHNFNISTGQFHLDFRRFESRSFFLALFHFSGQLARKGCFRTALELSKLLLTLAPSNLAVDPMCSLLAIDFYALRSQQYEFLLQLYDSWCDQRALHSLPNMRFSVALARFQLATTDPEREAAGLCLEEAIMRFPGVVKLLLDKLSIMPDKSFEKCALFSNRLISTPALKSLESLYVERTFQCWQPPENLSWLEGCVRVATVRADSDPTIANSLKLLNKRLFAIMPRDVMRHVVISGYNSAIGAISQQLDEPILAYDPLPPRDKIDDYVRPSPVQGEVGSISELLLNLISPPEMRLLMTDVVNSVRNAINGEGQLADEDDEEDVVHLEAPDVEDID